MNHRPLFPGTGTTPKGLFRCSVVSSIVKHQRSAIDPVTLVRWLNAAPTQEEGQSSIPANSRPTIEPVEGRVVFKDLVRHGIETRPVRVLRNEDIDARPMQIGITGCSPQVSTPLCRSLAQRQHRHPPMACFPRENNSRASNRSRCARRRPAAPRLPQSTQSRSLTKRKISLSIESSSWAAWPATQPPLSCSRWCWSGSDP